MVPELTVTMTDSQDTRQRIMDAALETIRETGITGASARAIAATGEFNQALIFYHFGSVTNLLIEAARASAAARVTAYRKVTEDVGSLEALVGVARRLHDEAEKDGSISVLTQLMAGAAHDPEMGKAVLSGFQDWIGLVEDTLQQATQDRPIDRVLPAREAAYAISALFLGIELMTRLDPDQSEAESVFDALGDLAGLLDSMPTVVAKYVIGKKS